MWMNHCFDRFHEYESGSSPASPWKTYRGIVVTEHVASRTFGCSASTGLGDKAVILWPIQSTSRVEFQGWMQPLDCRAPSEK